MQLLSISGQRIQVQSNPVYDGLRALESQEVGRLSHNKGLYALEKYVSRYESYMANGLVCCRKYARHQSALIQPIYVLVKNTSDLHTVQYTDGFEPNFMPIHSNNTSKA